MVWVQVQKFGTGTRYKLEILHQCGKKVKSKSQKVCGANSYVCRSYREKTGIGGPFCPAPFPRSSIGWRWTLQLIEGISNDLQNLLKYLNGTRISESLKKVFSIIMMFYFSYKCCFVFNDWELLILKSALLAETSSL